MASSDGQYPSASQSRLYEVADAMLQHSRLPRIGSGNPDGRYGIPEGQLPPLQPQSHPAPLVPITPYTDFRPPYLGVPSDHARGYDTSIDGILHSPPNSKQYPGQSGHGSFSEHAGVEMRTTSNAAHRPSDSSLPRSVHGNRNGSIDETVAVSPASSKGRAAQGSDASCSRKNGNNGEGRSTEIGEHEDEKAPPWSELKTKAGKERKRLPLACIACRRKKIRCSGEKPACKHCLRSKIPCVYKVTQRKAAPRTDYMVMLDKRLKRMEERVIKIIPKEEKDDMEAVPRAILKPQASGPNTKAGGGKKRAAAEAFGYDSEDGMEAKLNTQPLPRLEKTYSKGLDEGIDKLPSKAIQEHLSEVYFDYVYGQSYHLLHKPSFMRRLRAGTVPPVLLLAVCAISARFSTHPQINAEAAFLRGEEWAAPAREIALKRYDEPSLTILTVLLILGLHEFGTCQGGRSWMFGGMALRMAYALQLHKEWDHDPLGQQTDKNTEFTPTDREIRRRTMWACFLMDRFNSSGTERPPFANEETIKVQLPIKETYFQMEIPGPTESLDGKVLNPVADDTGQLSNPKGNMGACSYLVRTIALWGRVVKYLNLGGKQRDCYSCWEPQSGFLQLKHEAEAFQSSLPVDLQNNPENLKSHAAEKLGNEFVLLHISINQVILFLHRWSIPTAPGDAGIPKDAPKAFVSEAGHIAIEASNQISALLKDAMEQYVVAPFAGYCAFMSGAVHVWGIFSKNPALEASSKANLATNVKYLHNMKSYWGMFYLLATNLKSIYRRHADASQGSEVREEGQDGTIFQYGDWFQKYPHGVSPTDFEDPATRARKVITSDDPAAKGSELQSVENFFHELSPPTRVVSHRKMVRRAPKSHGRADHPQPVQSVPVKEEQELQHHQHPLPAPIMPPSAAATEHPISPENFTPHQTLYTPSHPTFTPSYNMLPISPPMSQNGGFPQQFDRHILYGGYTGADPASASSLNELAQNPNIDPAMQDASANNNLWAGADGMDFSQQMMGAAGDYGELSGGAWLMPFNMNRPDLGPSGGFEDYGPDGSIDGMGRMGQQ